MPENVFNGDYEDFDEFDLCVVEIEEDDHELEAGSLSGARATDATGGAEDDEAINARSGKEEAEERRAAADASSREGNVEQEDADASKPPAAAPETNKDPESTAQSTQRQYHRVEVSNCGGAHFTSPLAAGKRS